MPRAFSKLERENIRTALINNAAIEISRKGFRKLSIDALVKRVHISKGAFYLFYSSKEMLIFDVVQKAQESARIQIREMIATNKSRPGTYRARKLLEGLFGAFTSFPVLAELSKPESLVELIRVLPRDVFEAEFKSDEEFFRSVFADIMKERGIRKIDLNVLCGLPRMVLALETNKDMIGTERYDELKEMFIYGMSRELQRR